MRRNMLLLSCCFALLSAALCATPGAFASDATHAALACTDCHATQPAAGQPVDYISGDQAGLCGKCHASSTASEAPMAMMSLTTPLNIVNTHSNSGAIPASMKEWMIQWLAANGYPAWGDPAATWTYGCVSCHTMHGAPYPSLLRYNMTNGELCNLCHAGTANTATDWTLPSSRRVLYGPSHLGLLQADGVTEIPVPAFPKNGDVVSSTVNFPLTAFTGFHRTTADIAYRISIPGSVFNVRDINPANHMLWYIDADMVTWDTTLEANGSYTVVITPYTPSTMAEANPVSFTVSVQNLTLADTGCTLADKVRTAGILNEGVENSLLSKAANACKAAQAGNWNAVSGILGAFRNQTEAQAGKFVPAASAQSLTTFVDSLLAKAPK